MNNILGRKGCLLIFRKVCQIAVSSEDTISWWEITIGCSKNGQADLIKIHWKWQKHDEELQFSLMGRKPLEKNNISESLKKFPNISSVQVSCFGPGLSVCMLCIFFQIFGGNRSNIFDLHAEIFKFNVRVLLTLRMFLNVYIQDFLHRMHTADNNSMIDLSCIVLWKIKIIELGIQGWTKAYYFHVVAWSEIFVLFFRL